MIYAYEEVLNMDKLDCIWIIHTFDEMIIMDKLKIYKVTVHRCIGRFMDNGCDKGIIMAKLNDAWI